MGVDGEMRVNSWWNPPVGFPGELVDPIPARCHPILRKLMLATRRLCAYAKYRYTNWKFSRVAISHCGHVYQFDLTHDTFTAPAGHDKAKSAAVKTTQEERIPDGAQGL